jgi:hypothetical protein
VATFTEAELRAAVEAADNWGTYVATHAYTPASIQRSIAAGGQSYRARAPDGRSHGALDGRTGNLAEPQPFLDMSPTAALGPQERRRCGKS